MIIFYFFLYITENCTKLVFYNVTFSIANNYLMKYKVLKIIIIPGNNDVKGKNKFFDVNIYVYIIYVYVNN